MSRTLAFEAFLWVFMVDEKLSPFIPLPQSVLFHIFFLPCISLLLYFFCFPALPDSTFPRPVLSHGVQCTECEGCIQVLTGIPLGVCGVSRAGWATSPVGTPTTMAYPNTSFTHFPHDGSSVFSPVCLGCLISGGDL